MGRRSRPPLHERTSGDLQRFARLWLVHWGSNSRWPRVIPLAAAGHGVGHAGRMMHLAAGCRLIPAVCSTPRLGCILMAAWLQGSSPTSGWAKDGVFGIGLWHSGENHARPLSVPVTTSPSGVVIPPWRRLQGALTPISISWSRSPVKTEIRLPRSAMSTPSMRVSLLECIVSET